MNGTISVFDQKQTGELKLGAIGAFQFVANFKFDLNQQNDGTVTFSFQSADGSVMTKSSTPLVQEGSVETSISYVDPSSGMSADVHCSVAPVSLN